MIDVASGVALGGLLSASSLKPGRPFVADFREVRKLSPPSVPPQTIERSGTIEVDGVGRVKIVCMLRVDNSQLDLVVLLDPAAGRTRVLEARSKVMLLDQTAAVPSAGGTTMAGGIAAPLRQALGTKTIDGRTCEGVRVERGPQVVSEVWSCDGLIVDEALTTPTEQARYRLTNVRFVSPPADFFDQP